MIAPVDIRSKGDHKSRGSQSSVDPMFIGNAMKYLGHSVQATHTAESMSIRLRPSVNMSIEVPLAVSWGDGRVDHCMAPCVQGTGRISHFYPPLTLDALALL